MKLINTIYKFILGLFSKLKRRWIIAKAYPAIKRAYENQLVERRKLRNDINVFLKDYFGINAKSKYIPKDFKNKEEVKIAICDKFGDRMNDLNLKYTDLFN